ncbi:hypothetical protein FH972_024852 [Carpinus fangiana]|uniref:1-(5-phosphoribosyl)-5-[(5-phosphoribosylamino)methylideneamino] imidazole-4-carboxamide isomerase HISN3, chloroplastic n=1 Tax=Carpinus fangiana TaxID=176857 RepID=A0A5N6KZN5_9ROSI|nr:hypothetical protein FH972_024852 [Carpinus fangiana]
MPTLFRPCIDLHAGSVKQIVGGTLSDSTDPAIASTLQTNHTSEHPASYFSLLYKKHNLLGAHVIMLGPGNDAAAYEALAAWPGKLQVGGGITERNAADWIGAGAEKVIITSALFPNASFSMDKLQSILSVVPVSQLVIDLSCRRRPSTDGWVVATNKWQTLTDFEITKENIQLLEQHCSEFLIHAADNEGLQRGIDEELVTRLGEWCSIPVTYAGGGRHVGDLELVQKLSKGRVDLTIGSALDVFGGNGVTLDECVQWNKRQLTERNEI